MRTAVTGKCPETAVSQCCDERKRAPGFC